MLTDEMYLTTRLTLSLSAVEMVEATTITIITTLTILSVVSDNIVLAILATTVMPSLQMLILRQQIAVSGLVIAVSTNLETLVSQITITTIITTASMANAETL
jgi:hypothetical protein